MRDLEALYTSLKINNLEETLESVLSFPPLLKYCQSTLECSN